MDNKITKKRLSEYLSYEWILMIIIAVISIIAWELIYTMTGVKLTVGQNFKYYYDQTVYVGTEENLYNVLTENKTFSYDVLDVKTETLSSDYNVLSVRLSVQEGDILFTDCVEPEEDDKNTTVRAKEMVDSYDVYDYDLLCADAEEYLAQFLKDGLTKDSADVADFNNLDVAKIDKVFRERMKKDNRFRSEEQKVQGLKLEVERIKDLCDEVRKFRILLSQGDEYFFAYKKYEQRLADETLREDVREQYEKIKDTTPKKYGLRVEALKDGKHTPSKFFKVKGSDTAKDVVVMAFNFRKYQPHLQFETISFINTIVSACSNLYD